MAIAEVRVMIEIDGSMGEGGGQVLRTSIALSTVTQQPVRIARIRAGRAQPGLSHQHITSVQAVAALSDATVEGLSLGAQEIEFRPGALLGGRFEFGIGTAGSIPLVVLSCLLPAALSKGTAEMVITGGTDVKWSPSIDYLTRTHLPISGKFGLECSLELLSRGFYPEGGGEVHMKVLPAGTLRGANLGVRGRLLRVGGVAYSQNLPDHVVSRMRHSAMKRLVSAGDVCIDSDVRRGRSTGAGILLTGECENSVVGQAALGEKGVKAEALGEGCATDLLETIASGTVVDEYMLDQVLPYMATAKGSSVVMAEKLTGHAETNIAVIESFVDRRFSIVEKEGLIEIAVD
ncbi:MAG: RNA 3'-phosphate cyclase [Methanobacteriota archaeon]|nr:MAG: RNA 3'-phosphate cyclase [Euryarchaeota archaeon]